jgi:uncharacterized protein YbbK (DUF523 family)
MIIRVRGVPGSGKTYIAKVLRKHGIRVIDTDDVITKAYDDFAKTNGLFTADHVLERAQRWMLRAVYGSDEPITVVVGVTLSVPSSDDLLFIDVTENLHNVYERTVKRELRKYASVRGVDQMPLYQVAPYLACKLHLNAFDPRQEYRDYQRMFTAALADETKKNARVMKQADIIKYILAQASASKGTGAVGASASKASGAKARGAKARARSLSSSRRTRLGRR